MSTTVKCIVRGKGAQQMLGFVILGRMACVRGLWFTPEYVRTPLEDQSREVSDLTCFR